MYRAPYVLFIYACDKTQLDHEIIYFVFTFKKVRNKASA
jgi:hypothetical protein